MAEQNLLWTDVPPQVFAAAERQLSFEFSCYSDGATKTSEFHTKARWQFIEMAIR
jgi:hypothetical protein